MDINNMCCNQFGEKAVIQSELNRLNKLLADIMTVVVVTSQDDILAAVRGIVAPEWISADLVPPTEPGWYWVMIDGELKGVMEYWKFSAKPAWLQPGDYYGTPFKGTRYIKIKQPAVNNETTD